MQKFRIPKRFEAGFEVMYNVSDQELDAILGVVSKIPVGGGPEKYAAILESEFKGINRIDDFARTFHSLGGLLVEGISGDKLSGDLARSFIENYGIKGSKDRGAEWFQKRLDIILKVASANLKITHKAGDLYTEHAYILQDARIVTDIRIVFNESLEQKPRYGIIVHQLRLEVDHNGSNENHIFSLDANDLVFIREQIDRAIEKEKNIRSDYHDLNYIDFTD